MALNFLQQLLLPEGLFLRPGEELLIPVRYRVTGDDTSLELSGLGGIILFDSDQLEFLGYAEETAVSADLFQKPDQSYSEEDLYESLIKAGKAFDRDLDGVAASKTGIPFGYLAGSDALFDDNPNTTWDGDPNWPGINATAATSDEGLTLFELRFKALDGFSGSPLTSIVTTTHEGYEGAGDNQAIEAGTSGPANTPHTGTIRIEGKNAPGDTLTVTNTLQDPDGINNLTYQWYADSEQINDATSSAYKLTPADKGKMISVVASYTDNYGRREAVTSESLEVDKPTQYIYSDPSSITYRPGAAISVPITYSTSDYDANLSGIKLNIHYDSNILDPITEAPLSNLLELEAEGVTTTSDSENTDQDLLTDEMIQASWISIQNNFPGTELPVQIVSANFRTSPAAYDPVTGAPISTSINYTSDQNSVNYDFKGTTTTLIPESFHLDVDGDSELTALGDGLMVIRKMLDFTGNALTNMASSDKARVDTLAMHHWLQAGISNGSLDVDKDGETLAFGDGLMIIRYLFGFTGNALIDKALSSNSPYFGDPNAADHVMNNIDSLRPPG